MLEHLDLNTSVVHLVGNKCDLVKEEPRPADWVTHEEGHALADKYNFLFGEASARENIKVEDNL
jgi:hypothetical protein